MTTVILARFKHNEEVRLARFVEIANEMSIAGGSIQVHGQEILGVTLSSLSRESIPAELRDSATLRWLSIKSSSVSDDDLEQLQQWPNLLTVDLSDTNVTDAVFPYLEGRNIYSLDLSNTKVTAAGLAKYLKAHSCVRSVAFRNMQLTDDQLPSLYQPNIVVWDLASNRLTDQGVKALWENDLVGGLNLSANPITSAAFDATTRSALVQLTCEDCPIDDPTVNKLVVAGLVNYIHLGKTGITPQGLASLMSNCGILLRPGSFSEEELGSIDPACGNVSLSIVDCQVTGDFLTKWTRQPISLTMMRTKLSDEQVIAWSKTNWRPRSLFFFGHDLTDRCLPALRKLGPTHLQIAHGRISAAGLIEQIPTTTNLVIDACDYSPQELRLLRKSFPHITVQVYPFDYSR